MLVAHTTKGLWTKDDIKRVRSIYKKYTLGGEQPKRLMSYNTDGSEIWETPYSTNAKTSFATKPISSFLPENNFLTRDLFSKGTDINFEKAITPDNKYFNPDMAKIQGKFAADNIQATPNSPNWKGAINSTVPYLSNIVNSFRRLPNPNAPLTEDYITPNLVNFDSQRNELRRLQTNANSRLDTQVAHGGVRNALRGQTLSSVISGSNDLAEKEAALNAGIKNQTAQTNSIIGARNIERQNNYRDELISRKINQQRLNSENLANLSDKYQMNVRDKSLMDLENRKLDILPKQYESGVFDRNLIENYLKEKYGKKRFGGKMKSISSYIK